MGFAIKQIKGIGKGYAEKLAECEILSTDDLLQKCALKNNREKISNASGISDLLLLDWLNMSDLMRIKGIGEEYFELLEEAGAETVAKLKSKKAKTLFEKMQEINSRFKLARFMPPQRIIQDWIKQAKELPTIEFTH